MTLISETFSGFKRMLESHNFKKPQSYAFQNIIKRAVLATLSAEQ